MIPDFCGLPSVEDLSRYTAPPDDGEADERDPDYEYDLWKEEGE